MSEVDEDPTAPSEKLPVEGAGESSPPELSDAETHVFLADQRTSELPGDPEAPEFSAALVALRPLYSSRAEFNFMVCDQLALRGTSPNGLNVRTAGRWGNPAAIGSDVKAWYAALATRLSAEHANIPEAVKRGANKLIEQLWSLALESVQGPARSKIESLEADLDRVRIASELKTVELETLKNSLEQLALSGERVERELQERLIEVSSAASVSAGKVLQLQESISQAALTHQVELRAQAQRYDDQLLAVRRQEQESEQAHASQMRAANAQLARERERYDAASRASSLVVDQFRQDLKYGVKRWEQALEGAAQAKAVTDAVRAELSSLAVTQARLEQTLAQSQTEVQTMRHQNEALAQQLQILLLDNEMGKKI